MIHLYTSYYKDKVPTRQEELDLCLSKNLHLFDVVHLHAGRPSYGDFFSESSGRGIETIHVIANSDIYFTQETLELIKKHLKLGQFWCLTRWEDFGPGDVQFTQSPLSQDVWCWKGPIAPEAYNIDWPLGTLGCDNRLAYEMSVLGYKVLNPCYQVKTYHLHNSQVRNWKVSERLRGNYLKVHHIGLDQIEDPAIKKAETFRAYEEE